MDNIVNIVDVDIVKILNYDLPTFSLTCDWYKTQQEDCAH